MNWRASEHTEGPNADGYFTAGIDIPIPGSSEWHDNAIEFHHKDKVVAEARRNAILMLWNRA